MNCFSNTDAINIFKGDDTDWNGEQFITVNLTSESIDLSTMKAKFTLGQYSKEYDLSESASFEIDLSAAVTSVYSYGPISGTIKLYDSSNRVKTITNTIPFYVTKEVKPIEETTIDLPVPEGYPIDINVVIGDGGIVVDDFLSLESVNPVQNKVITAALNGKQAVISDLSSIRTGAAKGATAVQPSDLATVATTGFYNDLLNKPTIPTDNSQLTNGAGYQTAADVDQAISTKQDKLSSTQLDAVNSGINSAKVAQIATNSSDISTIEGKIPDQASDTNQLADKAFVNSSIATNTANFIGTFESVSALEAYSGTVTNNDYAFVVNSLVKDNGNDWATFSDLDAYDKSLLTEFDYAWVINGSKFDLYRFDIVEQEWVLRVQDTHKESVTLNTAYNRYKATVENNTITWNYEYTLNNSSFTASQWAAINSGITTTLVTQIGTNTTAISGKQDALVSGTNIKTVNSNSLLGSGNIDIDALPSQTGQSGKFLTTNGTSANWENVPPSAIFRDWTGD